MTDNLTILHQPTWQRDGADWRFVLAGRAVAVIMACQPEPQCPWANWLTGICLGPDHGWSNVEFEDLADAKQHLEQWWRHMCRGKAYRCAA